MSQDLKRVELIKWHDKFYVKRPSSWMGGLARDTWIKKNLGHTAHIVSPERWQQLTLEGERLSLIEDVQGTVSIVYFSADTDPSSIS